MESFDALLREAMVVIAVLSIPILSLAAGVGTIVAILQAATQIQEQTLTLLPKTVAVTVALAVFGSFGMHLCQTLFLDAITRLPAIVAGL
jgi:flagellar biosynthesis protein FliQ